MTIREQYEQMMELYDSLKQKVRQTDKHLYERWKAGGFLVDGDIFSDYPTLDECVDAIEDFDGSDEDDEDEPDTNSKIQMIADEVGGVISENYSGRGMFGETCVGIICPNAIECIEFAANVGLTGARSDNMGKELIVYWPNLKWVE